MIYIITGQTATGKTSLALDLAKRHNGELVNFDSRQIYKNLDIITGKDLPTSSIWLYDIVTPEQYFSSFEYIKLAQKVIKDIEKRGKTPILVGGSYFYLKHLLYGFDFAVPPDFKLREKLNKKSVEELQIMLKKMDKKIFEQINNSDKNNPRRLIRRIEILINEKTDPVSNSFPPVLDSRRISTDLRAVGNPFFSTPVFSMIGLRYKNKEKLRKAIETRVEKRLEQGAIEEVKKLLKMGYKKNDPGMKTLGYKQLIEFIDGKVKREKAVQNWINAEMQYAKRQYTFMKKDKNIKWRIIS